MFCSKKASGRPPKEEIKELKDKIIGSYSTYFHRLILNGNLDYNHMNTILDYLTTACKAVS